MYANLKLFSRGTMWLGEHITGTEYTLLPFTGYYSVDYPDWPIYLRDRYTSLFLIAKSVLLLLSVIITIWVKHKYPNLVLLD